MTLNLRLHGIGVAMTVPPESPKPTSTASEQSMSRRRGVRQKHLRTPELQPPREAARVAYLRIWILIREARPLLGAAVPLESDPRTGASEVRLSPKAEGCVKAARGRDRAEDALTDLENALQIELLLALRSLAHLDGQKAVAAFSRSGLGRALLETGAAGRLTRYSVDTHLNRMRAELVERRLSAEEAKLGLLAYDAALQGLSAVSPTDLKPPVGSAARDSLLVFARALHR